MKEKDYKLYEKLFIEAKYKYVLELFKEAFRLGYSQGYDTAVERLVQRN